MTLNHKTRRVFSVACLTILFCLCFAGISQADTINSDGTLAFNSGDSLRIQDMYMGINMTFVVTSGSWTGTYILNTTNAGGTLVFYATTSGTLYISSSNSSTLITLNHLSFTAPLNVVAGTTYTIIWLYGGTAPVPTASPSSSALPTPVVDLPQLNYDWLWIFLYNGDVFGFFQALFVSAFGLLDLVVGAISMLFLVPLYIRTKSLMLICILWILLGGFFIIAMPVVSTLAVLFVALGIAGLFYKLFRGNQN